MNRQLIQDKSSGDCNAVKRVLVKHAVPRFVFVYRLGAAGFIGHTQPRRICRAYCCPRIAEELGESIGKSVGYKIRFNDKTHSESLVK